MRFFVLAIALSAVASSASSGPVNESVNGWNSIALDVVNRLNFYALNGDGASFQKVVAEGATIQGLESLDKGAKSRPLNLASTKLVLSKCIIDSVSHVAASRVSMSMRCVGSEIALVDYEISDDRPAKITSVEFLIGAPPRINIHQVVKDD